MNRTLLAAAASLALAVPASMVMAQNATTTGMSSMDMTAEQRTMYDGWPADRRTNYDTWPDTYKTYYWTLMPDQQTGWWALNAEQRARVYALTPAQRTAAWASIAAQLSGAAPATTADMTADASMSAGTTTMGANTTMSTNSAAAGMNAGATSMASGNIQFVRNEMIQNIPMDQATGDVPICTEGQTDNCINAWEAGKRGPNVTRPLSYWPGKGDVDGPGMKPEGQ